MFAFRSLKQPTQTSDGKSGGAVTDSYDYKKNAWILETAEAPASKDRSDAALMAQLETFHQQLKAAKVEATGMEDASPDKPTLTYTSPISGKPLKIDFSVYPIPVDGEGMPTRDYPLLGTYPEKAGAPRMLQQKGKFQWFDAAGKVLLVRDFSAWKTPQGAGSASEEPPADDN